MISNSTIQHEDEGGEPTSPSNETARFLAHILPRSGTLIAAVVRDGEWDHERFETVEKMAEFLVASDAAGETVYHACASFKGRAARRMQERVHAVRAFWLDLDVDPAGDLKKKYESQTAALEALVAFCGECNLPLPTIVNSGYGVHVYWPLSREIALTEWKPVAETLKARAFSSGLKADRSRTSDGASILRPVGTHNRKHGGTRRVEVVAPPGASGYTAAMEPEAFAACLGLAPSTSLNVPAATANAAFLLPVVKRAPGPMTGAELNSVRAALKALPPDDYDDWIKVGAALHSTGDQGGFEIWDTWSRGSAKYQEGETERKWKSFSPDGGVGLGTLFELAKAHGYSPAATVERLTDVGNAMRLVRKFGAGIRYVSACEKWLIWTGHYWQFDEDRAIERLAKLVAKSLYEDAAKESDDERRKSLAKWASNTESVSRILAMVQLARSEHGIPVAPAQLDRDRFLLNCKNGTLDLRTGLLRSPDPRDLITKQAGVNFDPAATCPTWDRFVDEVMCGDPALIAYLQRVMGYCLTGSTEEQVMFIGLGGGSNGKTVLVTTIQTVLGDYSLSTGAETLMVKREGAVPHDIARLRGARFVVAAESEEGARFAESQIKLLTGGDRIVARFLYGNLFEFAPEFKLFLVANHRPLIHSNDEGIWRRLHLVNFERTFAPHERDKSLPDRLRAEASGILNWMLEGLRGYQRVGLDPPPRVTAATAEYRTDMHILGHWVEEHCERDPAASTPSAALFMDYQVWAGLNGHRPLSRPRFGQKLEEAGFKRKKNNTIFHMGLRLRPLGSH